MDIQKTYWQNNESSMILSFPIAKVNKEKRTVSGFASLDNLDRHGDIVTAEASSEAFKNFRGNIREMHGPSAVGRMLEFKEDSFFDKESGNKYNGVYVTAYISKGAQDAWEKCLDGTYTGFSIGGNIVDAKMEKADDGSESRRVIHKYELHELSLVDSPANPLANIFSIQKLTDGQQVVKGINSDVVAENVFWCKEDEVASTSPEDNKNCVVCGDAMTSIGWVEQAEVEKFESIQKVIDEYLTKDDAPGPDHAATTHESDNVVNSQSAISLYPDQNKVLPEEVKKGELENSLIKGGNEMTEETNTEVVATTDVETPSEVETVDETAEVAGEEVEKAIALSEVEDTLDFAKAISDLKSYFGESIEKNYSESVKSVTDISKMFEETANGLQKAVADLSEKYEALNKTVTDMYGKIDYVDHQLKSFESATAVKKSSDLSGAMENTKIQKSESIWQGHFLGVNSFTK
jgi:hypothetical protein